MPSIFCASFCCLDFFSCGTRFCVLSGWIPDYQTLPRIRRLLAGLRSRFYCGHHITVMGLHGSGVSPRDLGSLGPLLAPTTLLKHTPLPRAVVARVRARAHAHPGHGITLGRRLLRNACAGLIWLGTLVRTRFLMCLEEWV